MGLPQGHSSIATIAASPPQPAGLNMNNLRVQSKPPTAPWGSHCLRAPREPPGQLCPPAPESERVAGDSCRLTKPAGGRGGYRVCWPLCGAGRGSALNTGGLGGPGLSCPSAVGSHRPLPCAECRPPKPSFLFTQLCPTGHPPADTGARLGGHHRL